MTTGEINVLLVSIQKAQSGAGGSPMAINFSYVCRGAVALVLTL